MGIEVERDPELTLRATRISTVEQERARQGRVRFGQFGSSVIAFCAASMASCGMLSGRVAP